MDCCIILNQKARNTSGKGGKTLKKNLIKFNAVVLTSLPFHTAEI
jgi:hypothetical protein